jgi:DNA-directed RNA polymerase subunit RPC12/RpoP
MNFSFLYLCKECDSRFRYEFKGIRAFCPLCSKRGAVMVGEFIKQGNSETLKDCDVFTSEKAGHNQLNSF